MRSDGRQLSVGRSALSTTIAIEHIDRSGGTRPISGLALQRADLDGLTDVKRHRRR